MTPFEIVAGPLTLWLAPVGTAFPLVNVAPNASWKIVGTSGDANYDDDGIVISHIQKIETARPAGRTGPVKAWRTEEDFMISVKLWDLTLEQYANAMNGLAVTTVAAATGVAGFKKMGLSRGQDVASYALLARGATLSPYNDAMPVQYEVPRCFQSDNPKPLFKKGKPAGLDMEFTALEDASAATPFERFGALRAMHQLPI